MWRRKVLDVLKGEWDLLAKNLCFIVFGAASMARPLSEQRTVEQFFVQLFYAEFMVAGVILTVSLFVELFVLRVTGYIIYLMGLLTIAGLILAGSGSPVWIIVLAFAFQGVTSLKAIFREREVVKDLELLAEELERKRNSGG